MLFQIVTYYVRCNVFIIEDQTVIVKFRPAIKTLLLG